MTTPLPESPETLEQVAERYVADLPRSTDCAFNVAKKGQHRFCSRIGRKLIGRYRFCQRHAEVVAKAVLQSTGETQAQTVGPSGKDGN